MIEIGDTTTCHICRGEGVVTEINPDTGKEEDKTCLYCNGTGRVETPWKSPSPFGDHDKMYKKY